MRIFKSPFALIILYLLVGLFTIVFFNGTGGSGDSIYHYLYAKYAFSYPELFFDHWAKPLYVLIFSPFAQFGFIGVKLLNLLFASGTLYLTAIISRKWFKTPFYVVQLLLIFAPLYYVLTFSGLTEPFFAFLLILGMYLYLSKKYYLGLIIFSFLPFVRSEGLLFIGFIAFYELFSKNWKVLIYLFIGTFIYSIAGLSVHNDLFWVFTKIPYASTSSVYGEGDFFHFFEQLLYVVGIPFYILMWIGLIVMTVTVFKRKTSFKLYYLFVLGAGVFIVAHSLFWFLGIFNSMGLNRVLICILPLLSIIAAQGWFFLYKYLKKINAVYGYLFYAIAVSSIILFPFSGNKAALNLEHDLSLKLEQKIALEVKDFLIQEDIHFEKLYAGHPYVNKILEVNPFSGSEFEFLSFKSPEHMGENDLIIWDNWFSIIEQNIPLKFLESKSSLGKIFWKEQVNYKGRNVQYAVFRKL